MESMNEHAPEMIVSDLIFGGEIVSLTGEASSGKTAIAVLLARSIAAGQRFLDHETLAGPVAYVAFSRSDEVRRRLYEPEGSELPVSLVAHSRSVGALLNLADNLKKQVEQPRLIILDELHLDDDRDAADGMAAVLWDVKHRFSRSAIVVVVGDSVPRRYRQMFDTGLLVRPIDETLKGSLEVSHRCSGSRGPDMTFELQQERSWPSERTFVTAVHAARKVHRKPELARS